MTTEELQQFVGKSERDIWLYLHGKGWVSFDCFNDYKTVWINKALNKSIVARVSPSCEITPEFVAIMIIESIWSYDGIYTDIPKGIITPADFKADMERMLSDMRIKKS